MKLSQAIFKGVMVVVILVVVAAAPCKLRAANDYSACSALNDFLSYSKCVAEIDSQKSGQASSTLLVDDVKATDGAFSLQINDGSGQTNSLTVTLHLTASTDSSSMAIAKDSNFGFSDIKNFTPTATWQINDGIGSTQYVYVKFFDKNGKDLKVVSAPIVYSPRQVNAEAEATAKAQFIKIYGRTSNAQAQFDNSWLEIAAYDIDKTTAKDMAKEKTALAKFISVNKKVPQNGQDWSIVHAIAYTPVTASTTPTTADTTVVTPTADASCVLKPIKQVLDVGSKSEEVKALQAALQCGGYLPSTAEINGVFDKAVEEAVSKFQEKYNLICNNGSHCGRVGPSTAKKLSAVYPATAPTAQVAGVKTESAVAGQAALKLTRHLTVGSKGADVSDLQKFLALDKEIYPAGKVTGTFGPLTEEAVKRFQAKHNLLCKDGTACGYVGPATIQKLLAVAVQ